MRRVHCEAANLNEYLTTEWVIIAASPNLCHVLKARKGRRRKSRCITGKCVEDKKICGKVGGT